MNCIKQIKTTGHLSENRMKLSRSVSKAVRKNLNDGKILREKSSSALKRLAQVSYFETKKLLCRETKLQSLLTNSIKSNILCFHIN